MTNQAIEKLKKKYKFHCTLKYVDYLDIEPGAKKKTEKQVNETFDLDMVGEVKFDANNYLHMFSNSEERLAKERALIANLHREVTIPSERLYDNEDGEQFEEKYKNSFFFP